MKYDDEHLAELLRALPAPPVHVVAGAKALFEHLDPEPEQTADESEVDETPSGHSDDELLPPSDDDFDPFEGPSGDHDPDGDGWS